MERGDFTGRHHAYSESAWKRSSQFASTDICESSCESFCQSVSDVLGSLLHAARCRIPLFEYHGNDLSGGSICLCYRWTLLETLQCNWRLCRDVSRSCGSNNSLFLSPLERERHGLCRIRFGGRRFSDWLAPGSAESCCDRAGDVDGLNR